jgi:hypothetical protein
VLSAIDMRIFPMMAVVMPIIEDQPSARWVLFVVTAWSKAEDIEAGPVKPSTCGIIMGELLY